ncbi:uncharacterized protein LOC124641462 [Helicoverpa zea]|uniref:uncharacterized protein LOC124641462 n=1 Tax=Helicoverpa zea TaxID=7113 RepID=UPI001F5AE942|nr:uncharacterized protein LOC124641462 [Helicoverpa zea]
MGKKRRRKDNLIDVPPDVNRPESTDSDSELSVVSACSNMKVEEPKDKYAICKIKGYARKYPEDFNPYMPIGSITTKIMPIPPRHVLSTHEIADALEAFDDDEDVQGIDIYMDPPCDGTISDGDSGEEDCDSLNRLNRHQLLAPAEMVLRQRDEPFEDNTSIDEVIASPSPSSEHLESISTPSGPSLHRSRRSRPVEIPTMITDSERSFSNVRTNRTPRGDGPSSERSRQANMRPRKWIKRDLCTQQSEWSPPLPRAVLTLTKESEPIEFFELFFSEDVIRSSRASYGDDAISYVQLKRDGKLCTIKCKICPEHKVRSKLYTVTLVIDEEEDLICSLECHDCVASHGGCKHAIAFVMWIHRRSEEPSCTSTECYWKKSKLSQVGTSLKCITAKEMFKGCPSLSSNSSVLAKYLHKASKIKIEDCELLKYQPNSNLSDTALVSMHQLVFKFKEKCSEIFIQNVNIPDITIRKVEKETRNQYKSRLWYELRYGRITASRAVEVSRCKTPDGTLISTIMGGQIPDTPAMRRGRILEDSVRQILQRKLKKTIRTCGLILNSKYPMIAGSPDGICEEYIIEIKCPTSAKTFMNYIKDGKTTERYYYQIQIQLVL